MLIMHDANLSWKSVSEMPCERHLTTSTSFQAAGRIYKATPVQLTQCTVSGCQMRWLFTQPEYPKVNSKLSLCTPWHEIYRSLTSWEYWMSDGVFDFDRLQCHSASRTDTIGLWFSQACETPGWINWSCVSTHSGQPCSCRAKRLNNTLNRVLHPKQSGLMLCQ